MNPFKIFGAGLSSWGSFAVNHWKKVLLWILLAPLAYVAFCGIAAGLGYLGFKGLMWLVTHTPRSWEVWLDAHRIGFVVGVMGFMILFTICHSIYHDGKRKLQQNDKVPSI